MIGADDGDRGRRIAMVTALSFTPQQWLPFIGANVLIGLTFGSIGALAGVLFGQLGGTYFMLFLPMIDLGIAQTPMFGDGQPDGWATLCPATAPAAFWSMPRSRRPSTRARAVDQRRGPSPPWGS